MSRILDYIAKYDETLTVGQLKEAIKLEQISTRQKETEKINKVKEDFKNVYLKRINENLLFGKTLEIYYIEEIGYTVRCEDRSLVYFVKGIKTAFSARDIHFRKLNENTSQDTLSEEELRNMKIITKEEYNKYNWHYNEISKKLNDLIG